MLSKREKTEKSIKRILDYRFFSDDKKAELITDLLPKKIEKTTVKPTEKRRKISRPSKDDITVKLLRSGSFSVDYIAEKLLGYYPNDDYNTLLRTTKRRVSYYLKDKGYNVVSYIADNGVKVYTIPEDSESLILLP